MNTPYAERLAKAALRIRTGPSEPSDLLTAIAYLLDEEAEAADRCPGQLCPLLDCDGSDLNFSTHHHCRWCNEAESPASLDVADAIFAQAP